MAYKSAYGASGVLAQPLANDISATLMQVDTALASLLRAILSPGDWTYLLVDREVLQVFYSASVDFTVVRAQDSSVLSAHVAGVPVGFVLTAPAVAASVNPAAMNISGAGLAEVSQSGSDVTVSVAAPEFTGEGLQITGSWPTLSFVLMEDDTGCCGAGGSPVSSTAYTFYGNGVVDVDIFGNEVTITVNEPNFRGTQGVSISGSWPNYTFGFSGSGADGTVASVTAGVGIQITGTPNLNPVVGLTATGVTAGTYGSLVVNAQGQLTSIDPSFNPPSTITGALPLKATRTGNTLALTVDAAAEGTLGVVALADADDPLDGNDRGTAVTPALLASVIDALVGASVSGNSTYSPAPTADYNNIVSATPITIDLAAGDTMLVHGHVTMTNTATPLTPVAFAMALFNNSAALIQGNAKVTQSQQSLTCLLTGPLSTGLVLVTTAVPSGASIVSSGLVAVRF